MSPKSLQIQASSAKKLLAWEDILSSDVSYSITWEYLPPWFQLSLKISV